MENTANLLLPFIMPAQAQKFVTHNESLQMLDALVMLAVKDRAVTDAPVTPDESDRYIVAAAASGAWEGEDDNIAVWQNGAWRFFAPQEGWLAWCAAEAALLCFSGGSWGPTGARAGGFDNLPHLGINTGADDLNRLAVAADASLLTHDGGSHRLAINKRASTDTASIVFQDNYAGRAEIGLAGDDALSVKVSADGITFIEAMRLDSVTGKPSFPQATLLQDFAINLYQDSGRMAGNGATGITVGGYVFPAYLTLYNGAAQASLGKFINDNNDYGGAVGVLHANVKALVDKIKATTARRYGVEFWVAQITGGAATADPSSTGGATYYRCLYTKQQIRAPAMTFHVYVRALDDNIVWRTQPGQALRKDGVAASNGAAAAYTVITPAEGWVSMTVQDQIAPYTSYGYAPEAMVLMTKAAGNRMLIACPALMGGITKVDDNVGIIAGTNSWPG